MQRIVGLAILVAIALGYLTAQQALAVEESGHPQNHATWSRFRGPNGSGVCEDYTFPATVEKVDILWQVALPGQGHGSPVAAQGRAFVPCADAKTGRQIIDAYELKSGKLCWRREFVGKVFPKHAFNSFASSTPALDETNLYYAWATPESLRIVALRQVDGSLVWEKDLGPFVSEHGFGASPVVYEATVILPNEQDGVSFVVALDCKTGQVVWQTPRKTEKTAYSTPVVFREPSGRDQLILTSWAHGISSLDPKTGQVLWEMPLFHNRTVGSPVVAGDLILAACGEGGIGREMFVIRAGDATGQRKPEIRYEVRSSIPYVPTPVVHRGYAYLLFDKGVLTCMKVETGEIVWRERLPGEYFSSPVVLGNTVYCLSRSGTLVAVATGQQFQILGQSELGETSHATPAAAEGVLLVRTIEHLFAVKCREGKP